MCARARGASQAPPARRAGSYRRSRIRVMVRRGVMASGSSTISGRAPVTDAAARAKAGPKSAGPSSLRQRRGGSARIVEKTDYRARDESGGEAAAE